MAKGDVIAGYHHCGTVCGVCANNFITFEEGDAPDVVIARCWCGASSTASGFTEEDKDLIREEARRGS